jgi:hypothetical protein
LEGGTLVVAPTFIPSLYTLLQVVTSTPIYTMEVKRFSGRIKKVQQKIKYYFFEGVQGNFLNYGL